MHPRLLVLLPGNRIAQLEVISFNCRSNAIKHGGHRVRPMHKIPLGNSGLEVSEIGIGVWQASSEWGASDEEVVQAVEKSCELGVNLFDTAEGYGKGHSEIVLGRAIAKVGRENVVVA